MSKGSFVLVLLLAACLGLLTGDNQLLIVVQIGDEFLCQDPIRIPRLMLSHVRDELNSSTTDAARTFAGDVLVEEVFSGDEYSSGDEEEVLLGDAYARDPGRFVDEEEEDEEDLSLSGQDIDIEASNNSEGHAIGGGVQCPECGKHFKNDKSMFGHLRSHPDRGYKGATPPAKPKLQPSDRDVASPRSSSPVDSPPVIRYSQRDPRLDTYEILAAYVMLTIKYRDNQATQQDPPSPSHPCSKRRHEPVELDVHGENSAMSEAGPDALLHGEHGSSVSEIAGGDAALRNKHGSFAVDVARADAMPRDEHGSRTIEVPRKRGRKKKSKEGREAHNKEKDVQSVKEKRPYICKHCKAEFTTHQALGGHMAAHNKDKRIQAQSERAAGEAYQGGKIDPTLSGEAYQGKIDRNLSEHEAKSDDDERGRDGLSLPSRELLMERFSKMFNKGLQSRQEPRGYMRHYIERKDGGSPPVPAASKADRDRRRPFDIDLNVQAPEQE